MSAANPSRIALAKAIETKVEQMPMEDLLALASRLDVNLPIAGRIKRRSEPVKADHIAATEDHVLRGSGLGPVVSAAEGGKLIDAISVDLPSSDWIDSDVLGAGALASLLNVSRATLDNWRRADKVVALRKGIRNFVYPTRQFYRARPLEGLDLVAKHFSASEDTWEWLVSPNRMTGGKAPIELLREGHARKVERAAAGAHDFA